MSQYEKFEYQITDELGCDHCTVKLPEGAGKIVYSLALEFNQTGEQGATIEFFSGIGHMEHIPETVEMSVNQSCLIDDLVDMLEINE